MKKLTLLVCTTSKLTTTIDMMGDKKYYYKYVNVVMSSVV